MSAKAIDVLRLAHSFHCLKCDEHANCRKDKRRALKESIARLREMAQDGRLDQGTMQMLVTELQAQKRCLHPQEPT